jgi:hypothetical protein
MKTNIRISDDELSALLNSEFFIVKRNVSEKIKALFALLREDLKSIIQKKGQVLPSETDVEMGRIFQGENYKGLPYIILDFPKLYKKNTVFAFRTLFWWGNHFSCTLHLEGAAHEILREKIVSNINILYGHGFYYCIHASPWEHHFEKDNYLPLEDVPDLIQKMQQKTFLKISRKITLGEWENIRNYSSETLNLLLDLIA